MSDVVEALEKILPKGGVLTGEDVSARSAIWGAFVPSEARAILRPRSSSARCGSCPISARTLFAVPSGEPT